MYEVTKFPHGTFSFADCNSRDQATCDKFYTELMGWTINPMPMGENMTYSMYQIDGKNVAALSGMMPDRMEQGVPSMWYTYVTVDDVDALVPKVTELGGTVINPPFDVFEAGRMMIIQEPTGAFVCLWQPKNHIGAELVNAPGAMIWNELNTREPEKAGAFFSGLLGWEIQPNPNQEGYHFILNNGRTNGGILTITDAWDDNIPSHFSVYFNVDDLEGKLAKVKELGGQVHMDIMDAEGVGKFSMASDPAGAMFMLIQADTVQPWEE